MKQKKSMKQILMSKEIAYSYCSYYITSAYFISFLLQKISKSAHEDRSRNTIFNLCS